ncbi:uncharacterized protein LOC110670607 [Hevea brasiliensis]|uniref:uncharacterized protein LOC110670607 n=1 Tax=Hevea brasiliensis TaxID=3981 RepID=UPI0025F52CE4|nr:uncharacterized protein LOC110670607 [Hevea brasiliensis]
MASTNFSLSSPPIFSGENYQIWAIKMKSYLQAFDLWDSVENNTDPTPLPENPTLAQIKIHNEERAKKYKAKTCIESSVSETIFIKIMACENAKEAWDLLKEEYEGNDQTRFMQILNLKREFEIQKMKESENVKDYCTRLVSLANKIRLLGEEFLNKRIVEKIFVSLPEKFEPKISSLEVHANFSQITVTELIDALQAMEQRRAIRQGGTIEGALLAAKSFTKKKFPQCGICKRFNHEEKNCWHKGKPQCFNCKKFRHLLKDCRFKNEEANLAQEEESLF